MPLQPNKQFSDALEKGHYWGGVILEKLKERGFKGWQPGFKKPSEVELIWMQKHGGKPDKGDVFVVFKGQERRIETKSHDAVFFTSHMDYRYNPIYIDRKLTYDKKKGRGEAPELGIHICTANQALMAVVYRPEMWVIVKNLHPERGETKEDYYATDRKNWVTFDEIVEYMRPSRDPMIAWKKKNLPIMRERYLSLGYASDRVDKIIQEFEKGALGHNVDV